VNDNQYEEEEDFHVDLSNPWCDGTASTAVLGSSGSVRIVIIDDDSPGLVGFTTELVNVTEGVEDKIISIVVQRWSGSSGQVSCKYFTEQGSATKGYDYLHAEGELTFDHGQMSAEIPITICAKGRYDHKEEFRLIISEPGGGAKLDPSRDGGAEQNICTIIITADEDARSHLDRVMNLLRVDTDKTSLGHQNWKEQLINAVLVNGGDDEVEAGIYDWISHIICIFWKCLFALVPPTDYCGGWLCFFVALGMIALVTTFVGDLAAMLGCVTGIPDSITAITLVALGTSLPDTMASKVAAIQDPYADASVGNVTGSNSVNVFLGLGLPWSLGAIHWRLQGRTDEWQERYKDLANFAELNRGEGKFVVVGGDLGFSVALFTGLATACLSVLVCRRYFLGAELGGPTHLKYITSGVMVLLWILYLTFSVVQTMNNLGPCD